MKKRAADTRERLEAYGEYQQAAEPAQSAALEPPKRPKRRGIPMLFKTVAALAALLVALLVAEDVAFRLENVYVVGNRAKSAQQVVMTSGLVKGRNLRAIREEDVRAALARDHTIIFQKLLKDYPHNLYLYIEEREEVAALQWLGILYLLDAEGMVMSEHSGTDAPQGMPQITGLQVTNINVGQILQTRNAKQLEAYGAIMEELRLQEYVHQVKAINLGDLNNIYLETTEGVSVRLGDKSYMRAKIGAMRTDMTYLRQLGKTNGLLDVTIPEDAKYIPER